MFQKVPKVSIIIPVYNAIQTLSEMLETVCRQKYQDLEIFLVDDGSTDDSGRICEQWGKIDNRIRVFHKENGGVAEARNYGLERINGDYVMFIDADDLVNHEYVDKMVEAVEKTGASLVVCKHMSGAGYSSNEFLTYKPSQFPTLTVVNLDEYRWTGKYQHTTCWGALYSVNLIKNIHFTKDLLVGEDTLFLAMAMKKAEVFAYLNEMYYYYSYTPESIVHSSFNAKQLDEIIAWERIAELSADQSKPFKNECEVAIAQRARRLWIRAFLSEFTDKMVLKDVYSKAFIRWSNVLLSKELKSKDKLLFTAFIVMPRIYAEIKAKGGYQLY